MTEHKKKGARKGKNLPRSHQSGACFLREAGRRALQNAMHTGKAKLHICTRPGSVAQTRRKAAHKEKRYLVSKKPANALMESARDVASKTMSSYMRSSGEHVKDSSQQKYRCLGRDAPAYIHSAQRANESGSATAERFACLPTSSVPKKHFGTFRGLKRNVHAAARVVLYL